MMESTEERKRHADLVRAHLVEAFAVAAAEDDPDRAIERCAEKIASYLNARSLQLVDVVDQLGDKLTSSDVQDRAKAVDVLHYTLAELQAATLTANDLTYLVEFFVDRLRDQHLVIPKVILCLAPIVQKCGGGANLPPGSCSKILNRLFMEVNMQTNVHRIRRSFFATLQHMLRTKAYLKDLQDNTPNFVEHFIDAFAGEKDPRNLIILFNIVPTVLGNFPIQPLEEEFFEALACYFPIDFNPVVRPNSADTITREDLASGLHFCLSRTNLFSKFLIPLALEKLASDLHSAKLDSLRLLAACCEECYGPDDLHPFLAQIWHALRREIFLESSEQVEAASLEFIRSAFKALSRSKESGSGSESESGILKESVATFFSECKHHLSEPALRLSQPASKVLLAIAEANASCCAEVFGLVVPLLHQQFLGNGLSSDRKAILRILTRFVATLSAFPSLSISSLLPNSSSGSAWDAMVAAWFTLLTHSDPEYVSLALGLFQQLIDNAIAHSRAQASDFLFPLDASYRNTLQEHLFKLISKETVAVSGEGTIAVQVMESFAATFPDEFVGLLAPKLLHALENVRKMQWNLNPLVLKAISECAGVPPPASAVGRLILPRLIQLSTSTDPNFDCLQLQQQIWVVRCLNDAIDKICQQAPEQPHSKELIGFVCDGEDGAGVERFMSAGAHFAAQRTESADGVSARELCAMLAQIVIKLLRAVDPPAQQRIVDKIWNSRAHERLDKLLQISLLKALLSPLHPCVRIDRKKELMDEFLDKIKAPGIPGCDLEDFEAHVRLFVVLHNKLEDSEFEKLLARVESHLQNSLFDQPAGEEKMETESKPAPALLGLLIWTVKSLAMKGSPHLPAWIDKLINLLSGGMGAGGAAAAEGFAKIISDSDGDGASSSSLTPENNCAFKFLYKQRFFLLSVPKLIAAYRQCSVSVGSDGVSGRGSSAKTNYIKALSCQLKHVPKSVLHLQLENVIPLLIAGLSVGLGEAEGDDGEGLEPAPEKDPQVVITSLTAIFELFTAQDSSPGVSGTRSGEESAANSASLVQYFCDLAPRLLRLVSFKANMVEIRIVALKCLQRAAKLPPHVILPFKNKIVTELAKSLDDPKRLVRKEAVTTRNVWILSGAPGGL